MHADLWLSRPNRISDTPDKLQLLPHILISQRVSFRMRCKPTLRTDTALLKCVLARLPSALGDPIGSLVDASNHLVLVLESRKFRRHNAENNVLVLGEVGERLEAAGAGGIVFKVVCVYIEVL